MNIVPTAKLCPLFNIEPSYVAVGPRKAKRARISLGQFVTDELDDKNFPADLR
jgi:hypothetical protein